jgi:small subunit ribosomal protein S5
MTEENKKDHKPAAPAKAAAGVNKDASGRAAAAGVAKSVYGEKRKPFNRDRRGGFRREREEPDEFEQRIIDIARVTRVMAGGKRMRFRACVAVGNKKGKIGVGLAKGADVTNAVTKAVNQAKKNIVEVPIVNDTIPHAITEKFGAAYILFRPARAGRGIIAGGIVRVILEISGVRNITSKILGTSNKVNNAKCTISALGKLQKPKYDEAKAAKKEAAAKALKAGAVTMEPKKEAEVKKAEPKKEAVVAKKPVAKKPAVKKEAVAAKKPAVKKEAKK